MNGTVTKEVTPTVKKKVTAKKVARKRSIYCPVCREGPFKSKGGLAVHKGKPANVASHQSLYKNPKVLKKSGAKKKTAKVAVEKITKIALVESLIQKWMTKAANESKAVRTAMLDCVVDLKVAFQK